MICIIVYGLMSRLACRAGLLYSVLASLASIRLACCRIVSWFRSSFVMSCRWVHWWFKGCSFIIIFRPAYSLSLSTDWFLSDLFIIIRAIIRQDKGKSQKNNHFGQKTYPIGHFASARLLQSDILCLQLADNHRKLINSFYPFQGLGFLGFKASSFTHRASSPENGFHRRTRRQHFLLCTIYKDNKYYFSS